MDAGGLWRGLQIQFLPFRYFPDFNHGRITGNPLNIMLLFGERSRCSAAVEFNRESKNLSCIFFSLLFFIAKSGMSLTELLCPQPGVPNKRQFISCVNQTDWTSVIASYIP